MKTMMTGLMAVMMVSAIAIAGEDEKPQIRNYGMLQRCAEGDRLLSYPMLSRHGEAAELKMYPMLNKQGEVARKGYAPWR